MFPILVYVAILLAVPIILKVYVKATTGTDRSYTCLIGKTAIVTGANTGIGLATAKEFATRGARVILACRNKDKAEEARKEIIRDTDNENVVVKVIDMASLESVRKFAKDINENEDGIHVLVNNAGAGGLNDITTEDGLPITMQVNYFSMFLLTMLLLDKLKKSAPSRIVNVSSLAAKAAFLNPDSLNSYPRGPQLIADTHIYCKSKLCNLLFTLSLAERLQGTQVTVNALHPGIVSSELFRNLESIPRTMVEFVMRNFFKSAEEGAQTSIYLSLSKDVANVSGCYFADCKKTDLYWNANFEVAERVWKKTEGLLKLA